MNFNDSSGLEWLTNNTSSLSNDLRTHHSNNTMENELTDQEYIFDRPSVRFGLYVAYTAVFCLCFFGNLIVVIVVTLHWRMRSITKFCMGNLAFANLCVAIFCIYQNLSTFLQENWIFGQFFCKMYYFTNSLSHTASILILVVICMERYLSIVHPLKCRRILTIQRLRLTIVIVWFLSALISAPRLYYISIFEVPFPSVDDEVEIICVPVRTLYNSKTADMIIFVLLFVVPLFVMSVLYTKIGKIIWHSSAVLQSFPMGQPSTELSSSGGGAKTVPLSVQIREFPRVPQNSLVTEYCSDYGNNLENRPPSLKFVYRKVSRGKHVSGSVSRTPCCSSSTSGQHEEPAGQPGSGSSSGYEGSSANSSGSNSVKQNAKHSAKIKKDFECGFTDDVSDKLQDVIHRRTVIDERCVRENHRHQQRFQGVAVLLVKDERRGEVLRSRQAAIRMLIVIVITFALCNFPYHLRKMCQYYVPNYNIRSTFNQFITPITFLLMYTNCALNPILYAFMSKNFRSSFKDLLRLRIKRPNPARRFGRMSF